MKLSKCFGDTPEERTEWCVLLARRTRIEAMILRAAMLAREAEAAAFDEEAAVLTAPDELPAVAARARALRVAADEAAAGVREMLAPLSEAVPVAYGDSGVWFPAKRAVKAAGAFMADVVKPLCAALPCAAAVLRLWEKRQPPPAGEQEMEPRKVMPRGA